MEKAAGTGTGSPTGSEIGHSKSLLKLSWLTPGYRRHRDVISEFERLVTFMRSPLRAFRRFGLIYRQTLAGLPQHQSAYRVIPARTMPVQQIVFIFNNIQDFADSGIYISLHNM
jgi:hypothetical protein